MHSKKFKKAIVKKIVESASILFTMLFMFAGIVYAFTTWPSGSPPLAAPGDGNVELELWTKNGPDKIFYNSGDVGIGTDEPSGGLKLDVEGKIGATEYCDEDGSNCVVVGGFSGSSSSSSSKGMFIGWGEDTCPSGYDELYSGWIYQGGQNNGHGGDIVCSQSTRGKIYTYDKVSGYRWSPAPPCVVCSKGDDVGKCYTSWGNSGCANGFTAQYSGEILSAGQNSGQWKTSLVCAENGTSIYRVIGSGYVWESSTDCAVCCNDDAGGVFTMWGDYNSAIPSCPSGYASAYEGYMFQSGQRSGYGANAVCGVSGESAGQNKVYVYDGSYKWVKVPCNVCAKSNHGCYTAWGDADQTPLSGYTKVSSGNMYSAGVAAGDGGGLVCSEGAGNRVYVYSSGYKWETYPCSVYCSNDKSSQYFSWGSNTCAAGYDKIYSGYMFQGGQNNGYGGELKCANGTREKLYVNPSGSYKWEDAPGCSLCVNASEDEGQCYTRFGSHSCDDAYVPVSKGWTYIGGENGGYGQGTVCVTDSYNLRQNTYVYTENSYTWEDARPCVTCCLRE